MKRFILYGLFCLGWCGSFQMVHAGPIVPLTYILTPFDVPGSASTSAYGINNAGQIVGAYTDNSGAHGFLDTNGVFTTLPFVPTGINNVGQIVGLSSTGLVLDTNGTITNIAIPGFGGVPGTVSDRLAKINDLGQIVGNYFDTQVGDQGFLYSNGTVTLLPVSFEESVTAHGINNAGQIVVTRVGFADIGTYLYQNGQYTPAFTYLQGLNVAYGGAINNVGQIVAYNPPGVYVDTNGSYGRFGFYLPDMSRGGVPFDINDAGVIVGGNLLATPVPEPSAPVLFACGWVALGFSMRVRRYTAYKEESPGE